MHRQAADPTWKPLSDQWPSEADDTRARPDAVSESRVIEPRASPARPHPRGPRFEGVIIQGRGLSGAVLGHPTFNLLPRQAVVLRHGTYMATARFGDLMAPGLLYWGTRPTMEREGRIACELHLLEGVVATFDKAYDIDVQIEGFLRPDQRFTGPGELRGQLRVDRQAASRWFVGERRSAVVPRTSLLCGAI